MAAATIQTQDRLSMTVFLAAAVHAAVILGVGFSAQLAPKQKSPPLLEITLSDNPVEDTPDEYDYLAEHNQEGAGELPEKAKPRQEQTALTEGVPDAPNEVTSAPTPAPPPQPEQQEVVDTRRADEAAPPERTETPERKQRPTALDLMNEREQVARQTAVTRNSESISARYPSKHWIHAATKSHSAAEYLRQWVQKVETVGNLSYPEKARGLAGSVRLRVYLWQDGSIHDLVVVEPSPHAVLDQAALRIVRLAANFAPVPSNVLQGDDVLVFDRTIRFVDGQGIQTR